MHRYAQAWQCLGLEKYLVHEAPGYWSLLPSAGLAALSREVAQTLYTDVRAIRAWFKRYWSVARRCIARRTPPGRRLSS